MNGNIYVIHIKLITLPLFKIISSDNISASMTATVLLCYCELFIGNKYISRFLCCLLQILFHFELISRVEITFYFFLFLLHGSEIASLVTVTLHMFYFCYFMRFMVNSFTLSYLFLWISLKYT